MKHLISALLIALILLVSFPIGSHHIATAQVSDIDSVPSVAICEDGRQIVGYGMIIDDLTPSGTVRITALGVGGFDPAFAIINPNGTIECTNNSSVQDETIIAVPGVGRVEVDDFAAQRNVIVPNQGDIRLVVGGFPGQSGQFGLVIENLRLDRENEINTIEIKVPPSATQEWLNVFMVGSTDQLDPKMSLFVNQGVRPIVECDNAGTATCQGTPTLSERGAIIETADIYLGDSFDAGIMGAFQEELLTYEFSDVTGANTGEYIAIVNGLAPGAVVDTSFICENVITNVAGSSPAYNPTYDTEFAMDGDPATFWVTGASPLDPETGQRSGNGFVVFSLAEDRQINKIRINGYAQSSQEFAQNALRIFALRFQNEEEELVTAVEAELLQQPGYQSFSFPPALIDEAGLIMLDNYGGTLFTVVDVQICAVP